ncbi:MAG: tyrosine-type recombinase/integrase [Verrucomicrobia bacterium]|nr:tyrosine-type recombinase/integrase [Verrucomicrobiota bacterium]
MIERFFVKVQTQDRIRASWLGEPIERYVTWLHDHHYGARNVYRRVPILVRFAAYTQSRGAKAWTELPHEVQPFVEQWIRDHGSRCRDERGRKKLINSVQGPIEQMLRLVLPDFPGSRRSHLPHPFLEQAPGFFGYLHEERGVRPATLHHYDHCLRSLECYLRDLGMIALKDLSPTILSAFVTTRGQQWGKCTINGLCAVLRVFLRYLHREGLTSCDLSSSIEAPKRYRLAEIPRCISWENVGRMLEAVDRRTALGRRDYAILLLLVTYGLRSREIAALTLEDLDWERERLRIAERKAGHSTAYPLSPIVGEAILDYLKHGRPNTSDRHVFFRVLAPPTPFTAMAISGRAAHYLHKAGIAVARRGSHTLRHSCVQRLVDAHFSLKTIGDYVGHRSPDSTMIYSKVDVEALRDIARGCAEEVV